MSFMPFKDRAINEKNRMKLRPCSQLSVVILISFTPRNIADFPSAPFSDNNEYLSIGVHTCSQKRTRLSLFKKEYKQGSLLLAYSNYSIFVACVPDHLKRNMATIFGVHITNMPFFSSIFTSVSVSRMDSCERKAKNGAKNVHANFHKMDLIG